MRRVSIFWSVAFAVGATPALSQDVQTYIYDAQGRVIAAATARIGSDGTVARYVVDDADNRVAYTATIFSAPPTADKLAVPYTLLPTQRLISANGLYSLTFEPGGDLVLRSSTSTLWRSCTGDGRATFARVGSDGRLGIYDAGFNAFWTTSNAASPGAELILRNDGVAALKSSAGTVLWSSTTQCQ